MDFGISGDLRSLTDFGLTPLREFVGRFQDSVSSDGMKCRAEGSAFLGSDKVDVVEGGDAGVGEIEKVIGDDEIAHFEMAGDSSCAVPRKDGTDPEHLRRPNDCPMIDESGGADQLVGPVPGAIGDRRAFLVWLEKGNGRRRAVGRGECDGVAHRPVGCKFEAVSRGAANDEGLCCVLRPLGKRHSNKLSAGSAVVAQDRVACCVTVH